ncbi:MAG TPA: hypothetical protein PKN33_03110 [Phycisphaerae bacterium]|nr:hypothetical protein [Phycisphaerae bacterium]
MRHLTILALLFCSVAMADEPATAESGGEARDIAVQDRMDLETAAGFQIDYVGEGTIDILNNGAIVVRTGGEVYRDENDEIVMTVPEIVVFGTKAAKPVDEPFFAVLSLEDVDLEIEWGLTDSADGVITATDANGLLTQIEFMQDNPIPGPGNGRSCSALCSGYACSISCPKGKAAICYCRGATPVCECVSKPPEKKASDNDSIGELEEFEGVEQD